jgi:carbon monoxide dehydrogenase subunit G
MPRIKVHTDIDAPPQQVWARVRDIASHVDWMVDAEAIHFATDRTEGVGTVFLCDTKVGPIRLQDRMEVTEWDEGRSMTVRHTGLVTGEGRFSVKRRGRRRARFSWEERLRFPWWLGGAAGGVVGGRVLRLIWKRNLANLKRVVEGAGAGR